MERPDQVERKTSFNPEAAAFSPTTAARQAEGSTTASRTIEFTHSGSRDPPLPRQDSPFRPTKNMRPIYVDEESPRPVPVRLEEMISSDSPLHVVMRSFAENPGISTQDMIESPLHEYAHLQQFTSIPATLMPPFTFQPQQTEPNFNIVDMDELSASLGLPSAKKEPIVAESPAHLHRSRASQGIPDELYGTLLGRAREKPLTANTLAHLLRSRNETSEDMVKPSRELQNLLTEHSTPTREHGPPLKVVRPPPGFGNQTPRMVTAEDENISTAPAAMHHFEAPIPPSGYQYHCPDVGQLHTPFQQHHARPLSGRRRPRGHTRTKRTDQGPEPSAADIYPEDADWMPSQAPHRSYFAPPLYIPKPHPPTLYVDDATHWPTPAEVYTRPDPQPQTARPKQDFDIFEAYTQPSAEDMSAADGDVLSLIDELPNASINTLVRFGAFDLLPDERALTPMQKSGKRYGMSFFGIGIGDDWEPPAASEKEAFRVRPRNHKGWGSWEWAIKKGWADE